MIERNAQHRSTLSLSIGKFILIVSILCLFSAALGAYKVYSYGPAFMAFVPDSKGTLSYQDLLEISKKPSRSFIWFDRKRIHSDAGFASIDEKYPAQYEVWEGDKLIERWHWQVSHDPRTVQFGKYITRCVARYDHENNYIGMDQYLMSDFPKEGHAGIDSERLTKPNSIKMTINNELGNIIFENDKIKATWIGGQFAFAEQLNGGYPFDKGNIHPSLIINNEQDVDYLKHLSSMFQFLQKDVIEPYEAKTEFSHLLKEAPEKTKDGWTNFVEQMSKNPKKTQNYIKNIWNKEIKSVNNDSFSR